MAYINNLKPSREMRAKELIETYCDNTMVSFRIYKDAIVGVGRASDFVAYVENMFEDNMGETLTEYLKKENKGNAQDWVFGFLLGAATQRYLDSKKENK